MTKVTRPNDTFTDIVYDAEGRIVKLSNVKTDGKIISDFSYTYDKSGYIIEEIARQDGLVVTTSYTYDSRGQLTAAVSVNAEYTLKTEYSYDLAGNRITEKVSKTQWGTTSVLTDLTNSYDANNRLVKQTNTAASWTRSITYTYDENGNMVRKDTPDSSYTTYEYDSENRLTAVHDGGSLLFAALYDGNGDRVFSVAPRQNTGNWHDDWNDGRWEVAEPQNDYNDTQWTYGQETEPETTVPPVTEPAEPEPEVTEPVASEPSDSESDSDDSSSSGDDGSWWPGKYEGGDTGVDDGQWDPDGSESTESTEATEATEATQATEPESAEPDTSGIPAWDSATTYLGGDQVIYNGCIYEARWWTLGDVPGAVNEGPWKLISEVTVPEETEPVETEPEATEPAETEPDTSFEVNGSADYDYSLIQDILYVPNGIDTAYEEENYLLTGYINDINTAYTQVLVEFGTTGSYDSVYEYGVQRTTMYQNGQVYSYEYDGRGSVSELVNAIGETQIKYSYGAYGETVSTVIGWNNPVANPYRYNAERIDDVAGVPAFQYLRARYLNPYTATFLTQDTYLGNLLVPLSQNRYTYAHNNPVNYADPSGHGIILGLIITGIILVGGGAATYSIADSVEDEAVAAYEAAEAEYNNALASISETNDRLTDIYQDIEKAYTNGESIDAEATYLAIMEEYANYGNAYAKACFSYDEMGAQAEIAGKANTWKKIGFGAGTIGVGALAIGFAPALPSAFASANIFLPSTVNNLITATGMAIGSETVLFGSSDISEAVTGYNPMKELVFAGDEEAYAQYESGFIFASSLVSTAGAAGYMYEQIVQKDALGLYPTTNSTVVNNSKPNQVHHFATNKNKTYTPQFEEIAKKYNLDLDGLWNKALMPHQGRHPNAYHEYVLEQMKQFDLIAQGDVDTFLELFEQLKNTIASNPDMLYKAFWLQ